MKATEFVDLVDHLAGRSAIDDVLSQLHKPSGRKPPEHIMRLSKWFNELDEAGKSAVRDVIAKTAATTLFGVYCLLDGSRSIVHDHENERLDLIYRGQNGDVLIASTNGEGVDLLHEVRADLI